VAAALNNLVYQSFSQGEMYGDSILTALFLYFRLFQFERLPAYRKSEIVLNKPWSAGASLICRDDLYELFTAKVR
jgi:hypothetical protein